MVILSNQLKKFGLITLARKIFYSTKTNIKNLGLKGVSIHLGGVCLVDRLSVNFARGNFVAIVGNNGVGKTSLLKSLYGSLPYEGQAFFCDLNLADFDKNKIAYLAQKNFLGFDILVSDFLVMSKYRGSKGYNYASDEYHSGLEFLKKLGCEELYSKMFFSLSGGEQQLVWLAQSLNSSAELLLLDEPCQGLDVKNRIVVYKLLSTMAKEEDRLIMCVSHDIYDFQHVEGLLLNLSSASPKVLEISSNTIDSTYESLLE